MKIWQSTIHIKTITNKVQIVYIIVCQVGWPCFVTMYSLLTIIIHCIIHLQGETFVKQVEAMIWKHQQHLHSVHMLSNVPQTTLLNVKIWPCNHQRIVRGSSYWGWLCFFTAHPHSHRTRPLYIQALEWSSSLFHMSKPLKGPPLYIICKSPWKILQSILYVQALELSSDLYYM